MFHEDAKPYQPVGIPKPQYVSNESFLRWVFKIALLIGFIAVVGLVCSMTGCSSGKVDWNATCMTSKRLALDYHIVKPSIVTAAPELVTKLTEFEDAYKGFQQKLCDNAADPAHPKDIRADAQLVLDLADSLLPFLPEKSKAAMTTTLIALRGLILLSDIVIQNPPNLERAEFIAGATSQPSMGMLDSVPTCQEQYIADRADCFAGFNAFVNVECAGLTGQALRDCDFYWTQQILVPCLEAAGQLHCTCCILTPDDCPDGPPPWCH